MEEWLGGSKNTYGAVVYCNILGYDDIYAAYPR